MSTPPTKLPDTDLSSVFGKRTDGLAGARRQRRSPTQPPAGESSVTPTPAPASAGQTVPEQSDAVAEAEESASRSAPAPVVAQSASEPQKVAKEVHKNVHIYLPSVLAEQLADYRKANKLTNAVVVMNAIDACVNHGTGDPLARLRSLVESTLVSPASGTSLFDRTPQRIRDDALGNAVQVMLRISDSQKATFKQISEQVGAIDLGHLSAVALKDFFSIDKDKT